MSPLITNKGRQPTKASQVHRSAFTEQGVTLGNPISNFEKPETQFDSCCRKLQIVTLFHFRFVGPPKSCLIPKSRRWEMERILPARFKCGCYRRSLFSITASALTVFISFAFAVDWLKREEDRRRKKKKPLSLPSFLWKATKDERNETKRTFLSVYVNFRLVHTRDVIRNRSGS